LSRVAQQRIGLTSTGGGTLVTTVVMSDMDEILEPSTSALLLGALTLGAALGRRRFRLPQEIVNR
tara:strand:- start:1070 stop:1264 length:195 start_codon:yes stop_codon:yes gene_type:complete